MVPKDVLYTETLGSPFIGYYDLLMINKHYNCTDKLGEAGDSPREDFMKCNYWIKVRFLDLEPSYLPHIKLLLL
ncbi:hypothetical protein TELCIR_08591 [Teladorsagia circumcincta]|uniref:Peptidase M12A domain-containing protein n=1 Tax=Teladorsagia circumcincta TaxID=45464 RepID=A0A2G9UJA7_TELCI|nr:hypothetical protein TELCIR_08591 [Teladorsagia circumcincta]